MGPATGIILLIFGIILFIGNVSGWWPSFPYAGFIYNVVGNIDPESFR